MGRFRKSLCQAQLRLGDSRRDLLESLDRGAVLFQTELGLAEHQQRGRIVRFQREGIQELLPRPHQVLLRHRVAKQCGAADQVRRLMHWTVIGRQLL